MHSEPRSAREVEKLEEKWWSSTKSRRLKRAVRATREDYELAGWEGPVKLSELFGGKSDLIVIHNMGRGCRYCTLWADGFNGVAEHLANRSAFVVCSPDSTDVQKEFAAGRNWRFRMVSGKDSPFTQDMGFRSDSRGAGSVQLPQVPEGRCGGRRAAFVTSILLGVWQPIALLSDGVNSGVPQTATSAHRRASSVAARRGRLSILWRREGRVGDSTR